MEKKELHEQRNNLVVKSNELIRNVRYSLSEQEQKIIIFLISQIGKNDTELNKISIRLKDYCEIAGIEYYGGSIKHLKDTIKGIADKSWWIKDNEDIDNLFRWIDTAQINGETAEIILSQSLKPFVLQLKENFTKYEMIEVLALRGKYTIRLYELFRSYLWLGKWRVKVNELRDLIQCDKYKAFKEFNRNILKYSTDEINKYSGLEVSYLTIKKGRYIEEIEFQIEEKKGYQMTIDMILNRNARLG